MRQPRSKRSRDSAGWYFFFFLGRHLKGLSTVPRPISQLLEKDTAWYWGPQQQKAFETVKEMLTTAPTLAIYNPEKPTVVSSDASSYGLGGVLVQQHSDGSWRPIAFLLFHCVYDGGSGHDSVGVCVYDGGSGYDLVGGCVYDGSSAYDDVGGCGFLSL